MGRLLTSLPSRTVLPLALAGVVFNQLTPGTAKNACHTFERDFLSESFVQEYHRIWDQLYVQGIKQGSGQIGETFQNSLQNGIKSIRESISAINDDKKQ